MEAASDALARASSGAAIGSIYSMASTGVSFVVSDGAERIVPGSVEQPQSNNTESNQ